MLHNFKASPRNPNLCKWSHRLQRGMWAWSYGSTWDNPQWRVQVYWPEIKVTRQEGGGKKA